jgi:hypothetical protein
MRYRLIEVEELPEALETGALYWSKEYAISAHLCACGCGDVIYLPIGPVDYSISADTHGPTLMPSVGNWNVCNAHYWIIGGKVEWASQWSPQQISAARAREDARRAAFYDRRESWWRRLIRGLRAWLGRAGGGRGE